MDNLAYLFFGALAVSIMSLQAPRPYTTFTPALARHAANLGWAVLLVAVVWELFS